MCQKLDNAITL